ncbi:MAG: HAD-IA family hydrolase, partial [Clostridia bacterium]|nr:HAD-IA family hydrolase [Clostridia bacterium]
VFSCFENISKPNVEIYKKLIEKYKLDIERSILIDDTKRNIISANDIGLKGILFNNMEDIKRNLK